MNSTNLVAASAVEQLTADEQPIVNPHSAAPTPNFPYTEQEVAHFSQPVTTIPVAEPETPTLQPVHTLAEIGNRAAPSTEVIDPTEPKTEKKKWTKEEVALRAAVTKLLGKLVGHVGPAVAKTKQRTNLLALLGDYYGKKGSDIVQCLNGDNYLLDVLFGDSPPQLPMKSKIQSEPFLNLWRGILSEMGVENSESNKSKDEKKKTEAVAKQKKVAGENKKKRDDQKAARDQAKAAAELQKKLAYRHRLTQCLNDGTYYEVVCNEWGGREPTSIEIKMAFLNKSEDQIKAESKLCAAVREAKNPRPSKKQKGASGEAAPAEGTVEVVNATNN